MKDKLIYVYCISDNLLNPESFSAEENLRCSVFQKFSAIVKDVSANEFSEESLKKNFGDLAWIESHARDHIRIISEVMKNRTVIPFKFGTIFNSEESLRQFIVDYSSSLTENLKNLKGKEEWSVKIYCDRTILNQQIGEISEDVRALEQEISISQPGKAFILKRKKAELIGKEIEMVMRICGQVCYEKLVTLSEQIQINNLMTKELTERTDDMILNVSCFVKNDKVGELMAEISKLQEKYKHVGFDLDVAGSWPPFSFTLIQEKQWEKTL